MNTETLAHTWEQHFIAYFRALKSDQTDASHDLDHFRRVYQTAKQIAIYENVDVDPLIILAAAYLHDIVCLPKDHPERHLSSRYAAVNAKEMLSSSGFPKEKIIPVCHAIETHSFSAQLQPETLEAKIIQDADRMEALGALGLLRTFYVSGRLGREPFDPNDLHAERRPLDDKTFGFDHLHVKLFKLPALLQTEGGRRIAEKRAEFLHFFVGELDADIQRGSGGALALVWACHQAGCHNNKLFDDSDPMGIERFMEPTRFVIDKLIETLKLGRYAEFLTLFLNQFQEEVDGAVRW